MYVKFKLLLPALFLVLGFFLTLGAFSFAQTSQPVNYDVTVSPVFFDLSTLPGGTINEKVRVRNNTTKPMNIKIEVKKIQGDSNGEATLKNAVDDPTTKWFKFKENTIVAPSEEWIDIPFTINVPKDAAFGYYFALSLTQVTNNNGSTTGAKLTGASAIPVLLNVKKDGALAEGKVVEFKTDKNVYEYLPVNFVVKVADTGNVHIKPVGNIFIRGAKDKDLAILDVNQNVGNVLPGTNRTFTASWNEGFITRVPVIEYGEPKIKDGKPVTKLTINWDKLTDFRIGKYTANLLLVFDNGTRDVTLESVATFWVIPYMAIGVIIGGIIIVFLVLRFILKSYVQREIRRQKNS